MLYNNKYKKLPNNVSQGLSDTWLNESLPNEMYKLSNYYHLLRNDRNWKENNSSRIKKGGGVAMYIKNDLNFSETSHSYLNTNNVNIESQCVSIKQENCKLILIGNLYRPIDMILMSLSMS